MNPNYDSSEQMMKSITRKQRTMNASSVFLTTLCFLLVAAVHATEPADRADRNGPAAMAGDTAPPAVYDIRRFGALGDGKTVKTVRGGRSISRTRMTRNTTVLC